ncbi:MAG TPA: heparan-alpha-glucosaminide N-acetyltransferase domain-containing protein [Bacteroidales bacterium]|nr:heparan-alpha-glucosaminide N-acetyltransferase domain-containing protein [Bacteroidales bacterium]
MAHGADSGVLSRFQSIDFLKGLAVMAMIQVHITELFAVLVWQQSVLGRISLFLGGPAAAPLFMVVMGYLAGIAKRTPFQLIVRGAKLIVWGLMLNIGMNAHLLLRIFLEGWPQHPLQYIFGVDILFLAGLSLILLAIAALSGRYSAVAALMLFAAILASVYLPPYTAADDSLVTYLMAFVHSDAGWSYFPIIPWAAYPLAGFVASRFWMMAGMPRPAELINWLIVVAGIVVLGLSFSIGWQSATNLRSWYHHQAPVVLWNLVFVAAMAAAAGLVIEAYSSRPAVRWLCWTGRNVTAFYVFQWLIIGNLATLLYQSRYPLQLLFWFIAVVAISSGCVWLWQQARKRLSCLS